MEYMSQASQIKFECLKLIAFLLRAATLAKLEEGMEKKKKSYTYTRLWQYLEIVAEKKKSIKAEEEEKEKAAKEKAEDHDKEEKAEEKEKEEESPNEPSSTESSVTEQRDPIPELRVVADTTSSTKSGEAEADSSHPEPEEDPIVAAAKRTQPNDSKIGTLEKIFSVLSIDRALCLLGAILPQELSVSKSKIKQ